MDTEQIRKWARALAAEARAEQAERRAALADEALAWSEQARVVAERERDDERAAKEGAVSNAKEFMRQRDVAEADVIRLARALRNADEWLASRNVGATSGVRQIIRAALGDQE